MRRAPAMPANGEGASPATQYGAVATHTQIASAKRLAERIVRRPVNALKDRELANHAEEKPIALEHVHREILVVGHVAGVHRDGTELVSG